MSRALSRTGLLLAWSLVLWGTILVGATLVRALEVGARPALQALVPAGESAAWAWANVVAIALALVAWPLAAAVAFRLRRGA